MSLYRIKPIIITTDAGIMFVLPHVHALCNWYKTLLNHCIQTEQEDSLPIYARLDCMCPVSFTSCPRQLGRLASLHAVSTHVLHAMSYGETALHLTLTAPPLPPDHSVDPCGPVCSEEVGNINDTTTIISAIHIGQAIVDIV